MDGNGIQTKDYWTIIALQACGHVPEDIEVEPVNEGRSVILLYTFGESAMGDYERWMRGVDEEPLGVVRKVQQLSTNFKNNLHRFSCK